MTDVYGTLAWWAHDADELIWSGAQNRCSMGSGSCSSAQMNLASDVSDAFRQAGITPQTATT